MPISTSKRALYPKEWKYLRSDVLLRSDNRCEGSLYFPSCRAGNSEPHPETGSIVCLTVAHIDHDPRNSSATNLRALCQRCHLTYDARTGRKSGLASRQGKAAMEQHNWDALTQDQQKTLLTTMPVETLAARFNRPAELFKRLDEYLKAIPPETSSESRNHYPPKALILNARRDLSFFEANFELIDNSIDEWRKNGGNNTLKIEMYYDLELLTGEFEDDAGGMAEADVYKVFIPGESTNSDYSQSVIGSFGMGAKKAIFRLSDGAKVVSCTSDEFSVTSAVPERWEAEKEWRTTSGRSQAIGKGKTKFYFLKLILPPTIEDVSELNKRVGQVYAPLLRGDGGNETIEIRINKVDITPASGIIFSGAAGSGAARI